MALRCPRSHPTKATVSAPTTDPEAPVPAPPAAGEQPAPSGLLRVTAIVALVGVVVGLIGFALLLRPVSTPVQDCGTSLVFLLTGRANTYADPADPPAGVTKAEAKANNARPCRTRVADQSLPPALVMVGGVALATGAAVVEMTSRGLAWRRRRRRRLAA